MSRAPSLEVGKPVRVFFGRETRDGLIEHVDHAGRLHVRLSRGWVHTADPGEVLRIPDALWQRTPEYIIRSVA